MTAYCNARYLLPRFAVRLLSDLAVRSADEHRIVFTATHFSRTYGPGVQAPRGTDERVRIVLAVEALVLYGLSRKRAAQIVSKIMRRTEEKTRRLANRYPGYRPIQFLFGRNARGKKSCKPATPLYPPSNYESGSRLAELDREIHEEKRRTTEAKKAKSAEDKRCASIRVEALSYRRKIPEFDTFFDRAFRQFCDERAARTRGPEFFRKAERGYRERLEWFEEPSRRLDSAYDPGRVNHRYGLAVLLQERGDFTAALQLYEAAAERLRLSQFPFQPDRRNESLATLKRAMEDCRAGLPLRREN